MSLSWLYASGESGMEENASEKSKIDKQSIEGKRNILTSENIENKTNRLENIYQKPRNDPVGLHRKARQLLNDDADELIVKRRKGALATAADIEIRVDESSKEIAVAKDSEYENACQTNKNSVETKDCSSGLRGKQKMTVNQVQDVSEAESLSVQHEEALNAQKIFDQIIFEQSPEIYNLIKMLGSNMSLNMQQAEPSVVISNLTESFQEQMVMRMLTQPTDHMAMSAMIMNTHNQDVKDKTKNVDSDDF